MYKTTSMFATLARCLRLESSYNLLKRSPIRPNFRCFYESGITFSPRVPPGRQSKPSPEYEAPLALSSKYKVFDDSDAKVIVNTFEEKLENDEQEQFEEFAGINLERGLSGVFEIEDLVELLRRENANDIVVISIHPDCKFVEHLCIVSSRSARHMSAIIEFVRRVYKKKRHPKDLIPITEGKTSTEWQALDLGNIALHVFSPKAREHYDLEQLWAVGSQYDSISQAPDDDIIKLLEKHSKYLVDFEPAEDVDNVKK